MPIEILMPALSPTMEHGTLAKWVKKEGDEVKAGDVMAEIETDKATMEVEAVDEGVIAKILVKEGAEGVKVGSLIAVLIEEGESAEDIDKFIKSRSSSNSQSPDKNNIDSSDTDAEGKSSTQGAGTIAQKVVKIEDKRQNNDQPNEKKQELNKGEKQRIFISPLAKRMAENEQINISDLTGTGPRGRIIKSDILAIIKQGGAGQYTNKITRHTELYETKPHSNMRKTIAKRLLESKQLIPHFYLSAECCIDTLITIRREINQSIGEDKSKKLSINDFVIMAASKALKEVPQVNSSWSDDAILSYNNIDISVAVSIDDGLITPIIKNADQKDIFTISDEMKKLAGKAREKSLKPEEYQGGGFSISNLGMYGIKSFSAIINPPQSCILAVGAAEEKAVVINGVISTKTFMSITLSCDHRIVDGVIGAKFLQSFKKFIESPILMFI